MSSSLKISKPNKISDDGVLIIHCPNKFLQQRLMESKNLEILEKVFEEIIGAKLIISVEVDAKLAVISDKETDQVVKIEADKKDKSIDNLLETFGGQVVE